MKTLLTILILVILFGCGQTSKETNGQWRTIEVGDYLFDFPPDFKLIKEKGIDSNIGKVTGDSMWFGFDFGYYSNSLSKSPQEYLENGNWKLSAAASHMDLTESTVPKLYVLQVRPATISDSSIGKGCDFVAKCVVKNKQFDFAIYLPDEIKQHIIKIDTIDNQYRKIVLAKNPQNGTTGIYIRPLNSFDETINSFLALSMATSKLTQQQQEIALKIFKTGRHKQETN